jgi:hypothetical protein
MEFWRKYYPNDWYGVMTKFSQIVHGREMEQPFRLVTPEDAQKWLGQAFNWHLEKNPVPQPLGKLQDHASVLSVLG